MTPEFKEQVFALFDSIDLAELSEKDDKEAAKQIFNENSEYLKLKCLADIRAISRATKLTTKWVVFWSILSLCAAVITFIALWISAAV